MKTNQRALRGSLKDSIEEVRALLRRTAELQKDPKRQGDLLQKNLRDLNTALDQIQVASTQLAESREVDSPPESQILVRHQDLFEAAPAGYLVTDYQGLILKTNQIASTLLKIPQKYLLGKVLDDFLPDDQRNSLLEILDTLRKSVDPQALELTLNSRHGDVLNLIATVSNNEQGELRWILIDVTPQKQREGQILEQLRAERQQAIQSQNEFLSVAAHELKTPVTSLRGFTQVLIRQLNRQGGIDPERVGQALDTLEAQSQKLTRLLAQLLDTARIEAGRLALDRREINLASLVQSVIATTQTDSTRNTIQFRAPPNVVLLADPIRLEQVVINLLDNAIKFSPEGTPIVIDIDSPAVKEIRLTITDHGIGILPDQRVHLFSRFHQGQEQRSIGGMGLGLYISRQIVELHGGHLDAEFPAEGGTRFIITLPAGLDATVHNDQDGGDSPVNKTAA